MQEEVNDPKGLHNDDVENTDDDHNHGSSSLKLTEEEAKARLEMIISAMRQRINVLVQRRRRRRNADDNGTIATEPVTITRNIASQEQQESLFQLVQRYPSVLSYSYDLPTAHDGFVSRQAYVLHWLAGLSQLEEILPSAILSVAQAYPPAIRVSYKGDLPIHLAIKSRNLNLELLEYLVTQHPESIWIPDRMGSIPLQLEASYGRDDHHDDQSIQYVRFLLEQDFKNEHQDDRLQVSETNTRTGDTALHYMASRPISSHDESFHLLLQHCPPEVVGLGNTFGKIPLDGALVVASTTAATTERRRRERQEQQEGKNEQQTPVMIDNRPLDDDVRIKALIAANPLLQSTQTIQLLFRHRWSTRLHWIEHYCQKVHSIPLETSRDFPLHSLLQCTPILYRAIGQLSVMGGVSAPSNVWERDVLQKFRVELSRGNEDGLVPLQILLLQEPSIFTEPRMYGLKLIQWMMQANPACMFQPSSSTQMTSAIFEDPVHPVIAVSSMLNIPSEKECLQLELIFQMLRGYTSMIFGVVDS